jgi:hypothetical protein
MVHNCVCPLKAFQSYKDYYMTWQEHHTSRCYLTCIYYIPTINNVILETIQTSAVEDSKS